MSVGDPLWTEQVENEEGAQDPLAMTRVSNRLLGDLFPGITTTTPRARYISHHAWAIWDAEQRDSPANETELYEELYRRERVLALASCQHAVGEQESSRNHNSIVGTRNVNDILYDETDPILLDFRFVGNPGGSYDEAYTGPMNTMGVTSETKDSQYRTVTERGERLAEAYDDLVEKTAMREIIERGNISRSQLRDLADKICLCEVCTDTALDREPLRDIYLRVESGDDVDVKDTRRAQSLRLLLTIANQVEDKHFSSTTFADACYYGTIEADGGYQPISIPDHLSSQAARWRAFRAHDYFGYASEVVLESWLAFLETQPETESTIEHFEAQATSSSACEHLTEWLDMSISPETPLESIIDGFWPETDASGLTGTATGAAPTMKHSRSEQFFDSVLQENKDNCDWDRVHAAWPGLLFALVLRFEQATGETASGWEWLRSHTAEDLTPVRFADELKTHLHEGATLEQFMSWFIEEYVITRAENVRQQKESGVKFGGWFRRQDTGWEKVRDHSAGHWSARFSSAVSILRDLGLLNPDPNKVNLTPAGHEIMEQSITVTNND